MSNNITIVVQCLLSEFVRKQVTRACFGEHGPPGSTTRRFNGGRAASPCGGMTSSSSITCGAVTPGLGHSTCGTFSYRAGESMLPAPGTGIGMSSSPSLSLKSLSENELSSAEVGGPKPELYCSFLPALGVILGAIGRNAHTWRPYFWVTKCNLLWIRRFVTIMITTEVRTTVMTTIIALPINVITYREEWSCHSTMVCCSSACITAMSTLRSAISGNAGITSDPSKDGNGTFINVKEFANRSNRFIDIIYSSNDSRIS